MSEETVADDLPPPRWRRRIAITLLVLGAVIFAASRVFYALPGLNLLSERGRHMRTLERMSDPMSSTMIAIRGGRSSDPSAWPASADRARYYLLTAMGKAVWNVLLHPEASDPGKLRAIADRLDATNGTDLQTVEGCLEIFALFEGVSPKFKEYSLTLEIYTLQAEGRIPQRAKQ